MTNWKWITTAVVTAITIVLLSSLPSYVGAQDAIPTNQNTPCQQEVFKGLANKVRPTLTAMTLTRKSRVLPSGEIVEVEIPKLSAQNAFFCARLSEVEQGRKVNQIVEVLTASNEPDGKTKLTLKLPGIKWNNFWKEMKLELASFPLDERTGELQLSSPDTYVLQDVLVSSWLFSIIGAIVVVCVAYLLAGLAVFSWNTANRNKGKCKEFIHYLNPVVITAGEFGKASLSNLQIFWFTLIVLGLLVHILLYTGVLSALSESILLLLGISAASKILSAGVDVAKNRLSFDNWSWLHNKGWLTIEPEKNAHWRDLILTDGSLDVYRYQLAAFSCLVGVTLLISGINVLATYSLPEGFLALLGLSNVVYIFGKTVAPNSVAELNSKLDALRKAEQEGPKDQKTEDEVKSMLKSVYGIQTSSKGEQT